MKGLYLEAFAFLLLIPCILKGCFVRCAQLFGVTRVEGKIVHMGLAELSILLRYKEREKKIPQIIYYTHEEYIETIRVFGGFFRFKATFKVLNKQKFARCVNAFTFTEQWVKAVWIDLLSASHMLNKTLLLFSCDSQL